MTADSITITGLDRGEVGMTAVDLDGLRARKRQLTVTSGRAR
jgi:hypothetical protein